MKRIGVIANITKPRARDVLDILQQRAGVLSLELVGDRDTVSLCPEIPAISKDRGFNDVDAVMALGGDGTMLRAARTIGPRDIPLIGVNIGSLGFLTSVAEADLERALDCLSRDDVLFSRRSIAACTVLRNGTEVGHYRALNDVVLRSGASSRVMTLDVVVGGDHVASYVCDGLIVTTPTGSTGHNLSAAGPIVIPETAAFVITVICPHTLSSRPLVVPDSTEIRIHGRQVDGPGLMLAVDGQVGETLQEGDDVIVGADATGVRFIHLPGYSYFSVLSQKLGWKGSSVR